MAVSKKNKKTEAEVVVEEPVVETPVEEVEVECESCKVPEIKVEVEKENLDIKEEDAPKEVNPKVKIRMRVDHHCVVAMNRYDLKAGKTYNVPANVKEILNKAGLLAPL